MRFESLQCDHGKPASGKWRGCLCEVNWAFLELLTLAISIPSNWNFGESEV